MGGFEVNGPYYSTLYNNYIRLNRIKTSWTGLFSTPPGWQGYLCSCVPGKWTGGKAYGSSKGSSPWISGDGSGTVQLSHSSPVTLEMPHHEKCIIQKWHPRPLFFLGPFSFPSPNTVRPIQLFGSHQVIFSESWLCTRLWTQLCPSLSKKLCSKGAWRNEKRWVCNQWVNMVYWKAWTWMSLSEKSIYRMRKTGLQDKTLRNIQI